MAATPSTTRRSALLRWAGLRVAGALGVVWGAATLAFVILRTVPGDPVAIMLGPQSTASQAVRDQIRADLGLDDPVVSQYVQYLGGLLQGDLGTSYRLKKPVVTVITEQLGPTVQLAVATLVLTAVFALLLASSARWRRGRHVVGSFEILLIASPTFWTGLVLLTLFSFTWSIFPISGGQGLTALVLPATTMALSLAAVVSQVLRHGIEGAELQPFALTARARGLSSAQLLRRHSLRHAALPAITLGSYVAGGLLGGTVIIEQLFGRAGLGRVTLDAIAYRDLPVVAGIVVFAALIFVTINLLVDAAYPALDPRLRGQHER